MKHTRKEYDDYMSVIKERIFLRKSLEESKEKDKAIFALSFEDWCKFQDGELKFENGEIVPKISVLTKQQQFFKDIADYNDVFDYVMMVGGVTRALKTLFTEHTITLPNALYEPIETYEERGDGEGYYQIFIFKSIKDNKYYEIITYDGRDYDIEGPYRVKKKKKWK
jgi:hypothetical protein